MSTTRIFFKISFIAIVIVLIVRGSHAAFPIQIVDCSYTEIGSNACAWSEEIPDQSFTILNANIGNTLYSCRTYLNKLCLIDVENIITNSIARLQPDIVVLQEILAPWQCQTLTYDSENVCALPQDIPQVGRILGDEYQIACDSRNQFECVGIKFDVGSILECEVGYLCQTNRTIQNPKGCDPGFTASAVSIRMKDGFEFDLANLHLQSTSTTCRIETLKRLLLPDANGKIFLKRDAVLLAGDFNFDPWRSYNNTAIFWTQIIENDWHDHGFVYHSGLVEAIPSHYTTFPLGIGRTVDFVISNFAEGVLSVMGETPKTQRLDNGYGTDHRALFGRLAYP